MGNLRLRIIRASNKKDIVGRFKPDGRCKKHSKHRQSPGVCSLCLREKLTQLTILTPRTASHASSSSSSSSVSSLSSYHSSSSASSCASPMHHYPFTKHANSSHSSLASFLLLNAKHRLTNSRSSIAVGASKKAGFWYRLLHPNQSINIQDLH